MRCTVKQINALILEAAAKARQETSNEPEPGLTQSQPLIWPVACQVGPGLEGAIACESAVGYVNGSKGWLVYRGYDIFDLAAHSSFEETAYLLYHGALPTAREMAEYCADLSRYRHIPKTTRLMQTFPVESLHTMACMRIGSNLMRLNQTSLDSADEALRPARSVVGSDEDSIAMETKPQGHAEAVYEFSPPPRPKPRRGTELSTGVDLEACRRLTAGLASVCGMVARMKAGRLPLESDAALSHAGNLHWLITGRRPHPVEERILDVALILHADHGMNASTFAAMVVASTLADTYFAVGAGIGALSGPLHGGANERVLDLLEDIGSVRHVKAWVRQARAEKRRVMGFGHRVYKAYDPRARVLKPLVELLAQENRSIRPLFRVAQALETEVIESFGGRKGVFPNVDFYSGLVYQALGFPRELFTPLFAVSRVAGWTARISEYLEHNRIFRPRAIYTGELGNCYVPLRRRAAKAAAAEAELPVATAPGRQDQGKG
jgi:citrate synthase